MQLGSGACLWAYFSSNNHKISVLCYVERGIVGGLFLVDGYGGDIPQYNQHPVYHLSQKKTA
jgi:hypothetical protein